MGQLPAFEELIELAEKDPEAFEIFRQQACLEFIENTPTPHQQRLMAVQNRVEMTLHRAKTPMAGLLQLSSMMHDSFYQLTTRLEDIHQLAQGKKRLNLRPAKPLATIINLDDWKAQSEASNKPRH